MAHLVKESEADIAVYSAAGYEKTDNPPRPEKVQALKSHSIPLVSHRGRKAQSGGQL